MERIEARGRAIGEAARRRAVRRLVEHLRGTPGVRVAVEDDRVTVSGRGLWRLPGLRWIGGMLR